MISRDSILRRLPARLDPRQALFLDGIRHAGEIAGLAYPRLKATLTEIAVNEHDSTEHLYTSAFLDAWSLVDVIDRFRALWALLPVTSRQAPPPGIQTFSELAQPIRDLRNVADHLAQRADYVVARKGTALGVLSWFTATDITKLEGVVCTIVPGTLRSRSTPALNPAGRSIEVPTGLVHLSAGEHTANLSEILPYMGARIKDLEAGVEQSLSEQEASTQQTGADLLVKMYMTFHGPMIPVAEISE